MSYHILGSMCVGVTAWFGWGGVVSLCRLKHYWSVRVGRGGWGLMAVWNSGFVSPGLCSGISLQVTSKWSIFNQLCRFLICIIYIVSRIACVGKIFDCRTYTVRTT